MRQKHVFYEVAKNRLASRLTRIMGAYRLGNLSMHTALLQSEKAMHTTMSDIEHYAITVQARRDLGDAFTPLSREDYEKLEQEITRKNREFEAILKDAKTQEGH